MNVAIIGAGLIGKKRASALDTEYDKLIMVCDIDSKKAKKLGNDFGVGWTEDINEIANNNDINVVIISIVNKYTLQVANKMLENKKHILCEKPLGRNLKESEKILKKGIESGKLIKTGFNHRFHPSITKAKSIIDRGELGEIINIRGRYGHGGRPGMEKEWRCSKDLCGGGELLDQGIHLIDLTNYFVKSKINEVFGKLRTSYWKTKVEDNAFFHLISGEIVAQFHVSWTNWKNIFSYEIFCENGYISINGLGGYYGEETLEIGIRNPKGGAPSTRQYNWPEQDVSWSLEWANFRNAINNNTNPNGSGEDGLNANKIIDAIYKSNQIGSPHTIS